MNSTPITLTGISKLRAELKHLKTVERPVVVQAIAEARAQGDISVFADIT
ncbi:MAG: transcription elongation factor GreA, partial [Gammaproteobacteria bacterium]|nr:transcription elongation factor GreA [Gammaproteobacteria bacterium]